MKSLLLTVLVICISGFVNHVAAEDSDDFTLSGDDAIVAKSSNEISVSVAEQIAKACVSWAEEQGQRCHRQSESALIPSL